MSHVKHQYRERTTVRERETDRVKKKEGKNERRRERDGREGERDGWMYRCMYGWMDRGGDVLLNRNRAPSYQATYSQENHGYLLE